MTDTIGIKNQTQTRNQNLARSGIALVAGALVGSVGSAVVAALAHALGAPDGFRPLEANAYVPLVIIAAVFATAGWNVILRRSGDPQRLLRRLVPTVVIVSFAPDLLVGFGQSMQHTTWGAVTALMVIHLLVATALVTSCARFLSPRHFGRQE